MREKVYRLKEILKHPINVYDRYYYLTNCLNAESFIKYATGKNIDNHYNEEFESMVELKDEKRKLLFLITRIMKPDIFVETGVGASTQSILSGMVLNGKGKLYSIDLLPNGYNKDGSNYSKVGRFSIENLKHNGQWEFIQGDSKVELPKLLNKIGSIDMFFHDSLHTYDMMMFEYQTSWEHIKSDGLLLSDDVYYNHAFLKFSEGKEKYVCNRYFGCIKSIKK